MRCLKNYKLMQFLDNEYPNERGIKIQEHLKACPKCQLKFQAVKKINSISSNIKELEPLIIPEPPKFKSRTMLDESIILTSFKRFNHLKPIMAGSLLILIFAFIYTVIVIKNPPPNNTPYLNYVMLDNKPATPYIIKSYEKNALFIWAEKNGENHE